MIPAFFISSTVTVAPLSNTSSLLTLIATISRVFLFLKPAVAKLEDEIFEGLNSLGIAPLGFGGSQTVLGVNIEAAAHHPATLGVGISTGCWATRRGEIIIHKDLSSEVLSHKKSLTDGTEV